MFLRRIITSNVSSNIINCNQKINKNVINNISMNIFKQNKIPINSLKCQFHSLISIPKSTITNTTSTSITITNMKNMLSTPIRQSSTLKKRRAMMNKHKRKKRKKSLRFNTKVSRGQNTNSYNESEYACIL